MPTAGLMASLVSAYYRIYARYNVGAISDSIIGRGLLWSAGTAGRALHAIGIMKNKTWFARTSMRSVRAIMPEAKARSSGTFPLPEGVRSAYDLRVASILDKFSHLSFSFECQMLPLSTVDWKERMDEFKPHMLLVESAWEGLDESWKWKVSIVSPELVELVVYCRRNGIPTVFWNKEDPKHFETFIRSAELFDVVFTTDVDKIPNYKKRMGGGRVYLLPFAAQPAIHNPIETYERSDAFCFAGSYYATQMERNRTFSRMVRTLSEIGKVDIFDRYLNSPDERLTFPRRFRHLIVGTVDPTDIDRAYKGYYYGMNMNSIRNSQTMFARRAVELLASNTVVIGNYSRGLRNYLGDLTISTDDMEVMKNIVNHLKRDPDLRDRLRLAGLRKVMSQHTYRYRVLDMVDKVFGAKLGNGGPSVAVISDPRDRTELDRVLRAFRSQRYQNKKLHLMLPSNLGCDEDFIAVTDGMEVQGEMVSYLCPHDAYGPDYLEDLVLAAVWSGCRAVGKTTYLHGEGREVRRPGNEYRFVDHLRWRRALISIDLALESFPDLRVDRDASVKGAVSLSVDRFNYIADAQAEPDWKEEIPVDDLGLDVDAIIAKIGEGERGYISCCDTLRVYGKYPRTSHTFRAPYLHVRNLNDPLVDVICTSDMTSYYDVDGVDVASMDLNDLQMALSTSFSSVQFHLMDRTMLRAYENLNANLPVEIWVYGPEVELALRRKDSGSARHQRMSTDDQLDDKEWISLLKFKGVRFVFASASLARDMERLAGVTLNDRSTIVPLLVEPVFDEISIPDTREKVLITLPYWGAEMNIAALREIIRAMSEDRRFKDLSITLYGDWGKAFTRSKGMKGLENVTFLRETRSTRARAELFAKHSVILLPLTYDHNCYLTLEAMTMGLVPLVTRVGAVPEFIDDGCGLVLTGDTTKDAALILDLLGDAQRLEGLSKGAREKARLVRSRALDL